MGTRTIPTLLTFEAPDDWTDDDLMDYVGWRLDANSLDLGDLGDISAVRTTRAVIDQQFRPGDWAEHRTKELDPREVIGVGKDWLDLDLSLGGDGTPTRVPLDNYEPGHPRALGSI